MPIIVSADVPDPGAHEQIIVPSGAWDRLVGVAWEYGWGSAECPRGFEAAHLDPDEVCELIECYEEARKEQWDYWSGGDVRRRPPEWAADLPHPDEFSSLARGRGLRVEPSC